MSSNYQQKKMMNALGAIDTKGNIVLEQFQDGTALLFQPGNAQPFCVATDYDRATASWSYGKYFSDLGCAYEAADPEIIEDASVRWVKEDIREKLKAQDIAPTEFNVQSVIMGDSRLWERPLDRDFRDNMIASGNDDLDARVAILKENGNFKNVDTAMPVESLDDLEQYRSDRLTDMVTLFTSGMLEEKNGRLIVPQGYRPGMSSEEYQAWHPSARGNTAISVDTAISAKQLGKLEAIAASQKPQQIIMDILFLDPGDHLSQKSDPRDPMDGAFVDESHVAVPISPEFASTVASDMKDSIDAKLAGKRTKCDISQWHTLGKQARDMLAENSKHDRSLAAVRDAKTAVADKVNEGHQASSVHDNPSH